MKKDRLHLATEIWRDFTVKHYRSLTGSPYYVFDYFTYQPLNRDTVISPIKSPPSYCHPIFLLEPMWDKDNIYLGIFFAFVSMGQREFLVYCEQGLNEHALT